MDEPNDLPVAPSDQGAEDVASTDAHDCTQCAEYLAGWKRAQADYQNLKKDTERERVEFAKYSNERLLRELLPAIDQFSLALQHLPDTAGLSDEQRKIWENWLVGIRAVGTLWDQLASTVGLERVSVTGAFDPALHEAVGEEAYEGKEPGSIVRVLTDGWRLHGKVLRPARVILAK